MQVTDVVADMLTRIRNANSAKHEKVNVPCSNMKKAIADILVEEGFIKSYEVSETDNKQGMITITAVDTASDLRTAKVYVSVYDSTTSARGRPARPLSA